MNIFVGFHKERLFDWDKKPGVCFRYAADIYCHFLYLLILYVIFKTEAECYVFLKHLNGLHPAVQFTFKKEENNSLPILEAVPLQFESQIKQVIANCFFPYNPRMVYSTKRALPSIQKDCVPTIHKS